MTALLASAAGVVLLGFALVALAVWDIGRRALAVQVRQAELRVEALRRVDLEELEAKLGVLREEIADVRRRAESNTSAVVAGRAIRR